MAMRSSFERYLAHAYNSRIRNGVGLEQLLSDLSAASGVEAEQLKPVAHKFAESFWEQAKETVLHSDGPVTAVELEVKTLKHRLLQCNLSATKGVAAARAARHALAHRPSIEADSVVFHESLHHLDEETRNLVLSIVLEKLWLFKRGLAPPSLVEALRKYAADVSLPLGYEDLEEMQARLITVEDEANKAKEELQESEGRVHKFDKGFNKLRSDHNYLRQKLGLHQVEAGKYIKEEESEVDETENENPPGHDPAVDEAVDLQDPAAISALRKELQQAERKDDGSMSSPSPTNNESRWKAMQALYKQRGYRGQRSGLPLTRMQTSMSMLDSPTEQSTEPLAHSPGAGGRRRSAAAGGIGARSPTDEAYVSPGPSPHDRSVSRGQTSEWQVPPAGERHFSTQKERGPSEASTSPVPSPTQTAALPRRGPLAKQISVAFDDHSSKSSPSGAAVAQAGRGGRAQATEGSKPSKTGGLNRLGSNEIRLGPITLVVNDDSGFLSSEAGQGVVAAIGTLLQRCQSKMASAEQRQTPTGNDHVSGGADGRAQSPVAMPTNTKHPRRAIAESALPGSPIAPSSNDSPAAASKGGVGGSAKNSDQSGAKQSGSPATTAAMKKAPKLTGQQQDLLLQTMLESCIELSDEFRGEGSSTAAAKHRTAIAAALRSLVQKKASPQLAELVASCGTGDAEASKALVAELTGIAKHVESVACQTDVSRFAMETTERQAAEGKQLKVVLKDTHGKAKQLVDRAHEKGIGKQVNEIVEEIGFVAVGKSRSVFERLYADAVAHFDEHTHQVHQHIHHNKEQLQRSPSLHPGSQHHSPAEELAMQLAQHNVATRPRREVSKSLTGHVAPMLEEPHHRMSSSAQHASHGPPVHHGHAAPSAAPPAAQQKTLKSLTSNLAAHQEDVVHHEVQLPQKKLLKSLTSSHAPQQDTSPRRSSAQEERRRSSTGARSSNGEQTPGSVRHRIHSTSMAELHSTPGGATAMGPSLSEAQALLSAASAPVLLPFIQDNNQAHQHHPHHHHHHPHHPPQHQHHRSTVAAPGSQPAMDPQLVQALQHVAGAPDANALVPQQPAHVHRSSSTLKPFAALAPGGMSPCVGEGALRRTTSKALSLPRLPKEESTSTTISDAVGIKPVRARPRQWG